MEWLLALFARVALFVVWISTPLVSRVFHEYWLLPLLRNPHFAVDYPDLCRRLCSCRRGFWLELALGRLGTPARPVCA